MASCVRSGSSALFPRRLLLFTVAAALVAAGCTTSAADPRPRADASAVGSTSTTPPVDDPGGSGGSSDPGAVGSGDEELPELDPVELTPWQPETRTEELTVQLAEWDGEGPFPTQLAIDIFSVTVEPLPGATRSSLPDGDGLGSLTTLGSIQRVLDKLSPEQRAIVEAHLPDPANVLAHVAFGPDGQVRVPLTAGPGKSVRAARAAGGSVGAPPSSEIAAATQSIEQAYKDWRAKFSWMPKLDVQFSFSATQTKDWLMAVPEWDGAGHCQITVYPLLVKEAGNAQLVKTVFAHELFHCVQTVWVGDALADYPPWLVEGSADFAAFDLYRDAFPPPALTLVDGWFSAPQRGVAARSYDAWPLYESARQFGFHPYSVIQAMFGSPQGSVAATLELGGLERLDFQAFVSSQSLRSTRFPDEDWLMGWPAPSPTVGPRDVVHHQASRGIGDYRVRGAAGHSHPQMTVDFSSDVGLVWATGRQGPLLTISDYGTVTVGEGETRAFCVDQGGCQCPEGEVSTLRTIDLTPPMVFSYPQRTEETFATVRNEKWNPKKYCKRDEQDGVRRRSASSNGDPHLVTFDGLPYDVMALGEFVTVRDPEGGFEVQSRHELVAGAASATSAVAIEAGGHRIMATTVLEREGPITLRVDGTVRDEMSFSAGEVEVERDGQVVTVRWPDGSEVELDAVFGFFVTVSLPEERAARVVGMLGAADDNMLNDLRMPDGGVVIDPDLDGAFADAWAVDDDTTLFHYGPGESPATFRVPLPDWDADSGGASDDEALQRCTDELGEDATSFEIRSCAYDVAVTGNDAFVGAYQQRTETRMARQAAEAETSPDWQPSGGGGVPASAERGEPMLVLTGTLPPSSKEEHEGTVGSVEVGDGAVIVARAELCRPEFDLWLEVASRDDPRAKTTAFVCDPRGLGTYSTRDNDLVTGNEAYVFVPRAGVYDLALSTTSRDAAAIRVELFASPAPTVVENTDFAAHGFSGQLAGTGDSVVVALSSEGVSWWTVEIAEGVCVSALYGVSWQDNKPWSIGGVCHRPESLSLTPTGDLVVALAIFARAPGPLEVNIQPDK